MTSTDHIAHAEYHRAGQPPEIIMVDHDRERLARTVRNIEFKREAGLLPYVETDGWYVLVDCDGDCGKGEMV